MLISFFFARINRNWSQSYRKKHACTQGQAWTYLPKNRFFSSVSVLQPYPEKGCGGESGLPWPMLRQRDPEKVTGKPSPAIVSHQGLPLAGSPWSPVQATGISGFLTLCGVGHCELNPALWGWGLGCWPTVLHYVFLHCFLCKLS